MNKKGQSVFSNLSALGIGVAALAITLVVVFLIFAELGDNSQVAADTNATATVTDLTSATADIPDWVPIVVVTFIGALLISMVTRMFGNQ